MELAAATHAQILKQQPTRALCAVPDAMRERLAGPSIAVLAALLVDIWTTRVHLEGQPGFSLRASDSAVLFFNEDRIELPMGFLPDRS